MYTHGEEVEQGQAMRDAETFRAMSELCSIGVINGGHSTPSWGQTRSPWDTAMVLQDPFGFYHPFIHHPGFLFLCGLLSLVPERKVKNEPTWLETLKSLIVISDFRLVDLQ